MNLNLFKGKGLPDYQSFTPEAINNDFPKIIKKLESDFQNVESNFSSYLENNDLNWEKVMNPLQIINEEVRWSWGLINHLNSVNNSDKLREKKEKEKIA